MVHQILIGPSTDSRCLSGREFEIRNEAVNITVEIPNVNSEERDVAVRSGITETPDFVFEGRCVDEKLIDVPTSCTLVPFLVLDVADCIDSPPLD